MERRGEKQRHYSGDGSSESPFTPFGSPDLVSFSMELARDNIEPILKGEKIYATFNRHTFRIQGHPESRYFPQKVNVYYIELWRDNIDLQDARTAVQYSQHFYSSFLVEIFKKQFGM